MHLPAARYLLLLAGGISIGDPLGGWAVLGVLLFINKPLVFLFLGMTVSYWENLHVPVHHQVLLLELKEEPQLRGKHYRALSEIYAVNEQGKWLPQEGKAMLYFKGDSLRKQGELVLIKDGLDTLPPKRPFDGFDYKRYLERQGIYYRKYLSSGDYELYGQTSHLSFAERAQNYTQRVYRELLGDTPELGVAEAMVGGIRVHLDKETQQNYSDTGTIHALAVSGMHVAILFWVLQVLFSRLVPKRSFLFLSLVLCSLWAYAFFTGLSASVCRSVVMFSLFLVGERLQRSGSSLNTLFLSAVVLLLWNPNWLYDVGFQLSYLAVWGILSFHPILNKSIRIGNRVLRSLWEGASVSISATLFTLPLSLYYFHQFPNYFLLANTAVNLVCAPLLPIGLLLLLIYPINWMFEWVGFIFKYLLIILNRVVEFFAGLPGAVSKDVYISIFTVLVLFLILFSVIQFWKRRTSLGLWGLTGGVFLLFSELLVQNYLESNRGKLLIYEGGLSLIQGRDLFVVDESLEINEKKEGIERCIKYGVEGNFRVDSPFGTIVWMKKKQEIDWEGVNFVVISHNSCPVDQLPYGVQVVVDRTNSSEYVAQLRKKITSLRVLQESGLFQYEQNI